MLTHTLALYAQNNLVKVIHGHSQIDCYKQLDDLSVNGNGPLFDSWQLTYYNPSLTDPVVVTNGNRQWVMASVKKVMVNVLADGLTEKQINRYMQYGRDSIAIYNIIGRVVDVSLVNIDGNVTKQNAYRVTYADNRNRIVYAHNLLSARAMVL